MTSLTIDGIVVLAETPLKPEEHRALLQALGHLAPALADLPHTTIRVVNTLAELSPVGGKMVLVTGVTFIKPDLEAAIRKAGGHPFYAYFGNVLPSYAAVTLGAANLRFWSQQHGEKGKLVPTKTRDSYGDWPAFRLDTRRAA
jgi:hypothetical protein